MVAWKIFEGRKTGVSKTALSVYFFMGLKYDNVLLKGLFKKL